MGLPALPTRHEDSLAHRQRIAETVNSITNFQFDDSRVRTGREIDNGVMPVNFAYAPGHLYRYGKNALPGTTDLTSAAVKALLANDEVEWPSGDIVFTQVEVASDKKVRTAGLATRIVNSDAAQYDTPVIKITGSNVEVGDLSFLGNITDQTGEWNHCIAVRPNGAAIENVKLGRVVGEDIRGDVIAIEGTSTYPVKNVTWVSAHGTNIYRNVVSVIGCQDWDASSVTGTEIGYRLWDVEPNAGVSQICTGGRFRFSRGGAIQFAGDPSIPNGSIRCDYIELDNDLYIDSTPSYPSHGSTVPDPNGLNGNIGILIGNTNSIWIGSLKARNYKERLINDSGSSIKSRMVIDHVDIDDCNSNETTFKTLVEGSTMQSLEIGGGIIVLQGSDRYICKDVKCHLRNLTVSGGCIAASADNCEFEAITYDGTGVSNTLFADIDNSTIKRFIASNAGSATLMGSCEDNVLVGCTGTFGTINTGGGIQLYMKCVLNSTTYELRTDLQGSATYDPPNLAAGTIAATTVTVSGASLGDLVKASFSLDLQGIKLLASVDAANTVSVTFWNPTAGALNIASGTLRARVWKA